MFSSTLYKFARNVQLQALDNASPYGIHLSMSTVLPETSKKLAALHEQHGSAYVDAPIFGRPEATITQGLWIPFAGPLSQNAIPLKDIGLFKKTAQQVESLTPIANLLYDLLKSNEGRA